MFLGYAFLLVVLLFALTANDYGCLGFFFDLFMCWLTGGWWFIWMIFKFLRSNSKK